MREAFAYFGNVLAIATITADVDGISTRFEHKRPPIKWELS